MAELCFNDILQDAVTPLSELEAIDLVKTCFASATERDIYTVSESSILSIRRSYLLFFELFVELSLLVICTMFLIRLARV